MPERLAKREPEEIVRMLVDQLKTVLASGAALGPIIMAFVFIDAMARAGLPSNRNKVEGADFIGWVDKYMRTSDPCEYQYVGVDVYNARCAMLHTLTPQMHKDGRIFMYHDGVPHRYRPDLHANVVVISVPLFIDDLWTAVARFIADARSGSSWELVASRFNEMFAIVPYSGPSWEQT